MGKSPEPTDLSTDAAALHFLRTASKDILVDALDISPTVAARIIDHRAAYGFTSIDHLKKIVLRKKELLAFQDALAYAASNADISALVDDNNAPLSPVYDADPAASIKQRGSFSEKALDKAQRPCPRRVDCNRYGR